jgi:hypothetical protein
MLITDYFTNQQASVTISAGSKVTIFVTKKTNQDAWEMFANAQETWLH